MDAPPKRSVSVTAAAVVAMLQGLILLLFSMLAFFGLLFVNLPDAAQEFPPLLRNTALAALGFLACLSAFGIATGIGLIYLRNWARISILIWGGFSAFFGAIGIPAAFLMLHSPSPGAPALPAESVQAVRWILILTYGLPLVIGIWWLILFNRKSVKAQFAGATGSPEFGLPQKPRCPLPVAVLAWFYVGLVFNFLFIPLLPSRMPVFVFGYVLSGGTGKVVFVVTSLAYVIAGIGLLKLKPWSYSLTIGLQLFWLASSVVTTLTPNYVVVMDSYMREVQDSFHLPKTQSSPFSFAQHYGWMMVAGLVFAGAILGLLVYYRPRFLEEVSRVASAS